MMTIKKIILVLGAIVYAHAQITVAHADALGEAQAAADWGKAAIEASTPEEAKVHSNQVFDTPAPSAPTHVDIPEPPEPASSPADSSQ